MSDTKCPYCDAEIEIDHDDGRGYSEDELHEQQCSDCGKNFTFTTSILYVYYTYKADCLNGGEHKFKATTTIPKEYTKMDCTECEERRDPTEAEWVEILN